MKTYTRSRAGCLLPHLVLAFVLGILAAPPARAGLTMDLNLSRFTANGTNYYYGIGGGLSTNSTPSNPPFGDYFLASANYPNLPYSSANYHYDTNGFSWQGSGGNYYGTFDSVMQAATNGLWTLIVTGLNSAFTNTYQFQVTAHGLASNSLPAAVVTYPLDGTTNVGQTPVFTWQGPVGFNYVNVQLQNWDGTYNVSSNLPASQTSWQAPRGLPYSSFTFTPNYNTNGTSFLVAAAPTNGAGQPISSWTSTCELNSSFTVGFTVPSPFAPPPGGHVLVARYTWAGTNTDPLAASIDVTGNGSDLGFGGGGGSQGGVTLTNDAIAGNRAVQFHNGDGGSIGWLGVTTPAPVLWALQGSFSVSCWIKTSQTFGNDNDPAYQGAGIVAADVNGQANDVVPLALTGSKIGFNTGGNSDDTLNSSNSVNDGNYHHVVVTRDQASGVKTIYIDGVLDTSDFGTTNTLDTPLKLTLGALSDAGNINPNDFNYYNGFDGDVDDLQVYSGVLNTAEVAYLFNNPGATAPSLPLNGLVAHYAFDNTNSIGADTSGNGYDLDYNGNPNGNGVSSGANAAAGAGAVYFDGGSFLSYSAIPTNVLAALAGDLTISVWVQTTATSGNDGDPAYFDAGIVAADVPGQVNDIIPIAQTGGGIGFNTGGTYDDTLSSSGDINNGNYHQVVITRAQATGEKRIYIDGLLNSTDTGTTNLLNAPQIMAVGAAIDASQSNPNNANTGPYYQGWLDDLQIYSRVLSPGEVAGLFSNPGSVALLNLNFNQALDTTNLNWSTSSDADWFVETTNTFNSLASAAQSGPVVNSQASTLTLAVTGPGAISFYWQTSPNGNNFNLGFNVDGTNLANLGSGNAWVQAGPFGIGSGRHVLTWVAAANGDNDPTEAGYLDEVNFSPAPPPVITLNPASQTNYPGYPVGLVAGASSLTPVSWQWFEVGSGLIANATNAFFSPTNSGTSGVAGDYYAVASNQGGSSVTLTAAVTFVSAPLPPNWTRVFRSPFYPVSGDYLRDYNGGCAVDASGDVYVANQYLENINVENNQGATVATFTAVGANGAAALIKYADTNGPINTAPLVWAVGLTNNDPASYSYGLDVALAPGNGAYLVSEIFHTNWLGANRYADTGGGSILLSRFDVNGSNVWSQLINGPNLTYISYNMIASDSSGDVTVAGELFGTTAFGGTNLTTSGGCGFLAQYSPNGTIRWAQTVPNFIYGLAYGGGQLYASLQARVSGGVTNVSVGALSNLTDRAWAVACLNATNGQALWLRGVGDQYGANYDGLVNNMPLISTSGTNVFLAGNAYGASVTFGGLSASLPAGSGQFFARYDTSGNPQFATAFGSPTTMIWASAADASGVYVDGDFDGYSAFGNYFVTAPEYVPSPIGSEYFTQPFVAKFDLNGNPLWARNGVSPVLGNFRGLATTSGGVWASGFLLTTNELGNGIVPAQFGTNLVTSDATLVGSPVGSLYFTVGGLMTKITDSTTSASPVQLVNPSYSGGNFQFSFISESGFTHYLQYRTNLTSGVWLSYTNFPGNGTVKTNSLPLSLFSPAKQGFIRVYTQ